MARVDFQLNMSDLEVLVLGSMGFSTDYISRRTGYSSGQILYRLKLGNVKRADYRDGRSEIVGLVLSQRVEVSKRITSSQNKERDKAKRLEKVPNPKHHDWDKTTNRCRKCGMHETKAKSLIWGCSKIEAHRRGQRPRKPRKALAE